MMGPESIIRLCIGLIASGAICEAIIAVYAGWRGEKSKIIVLDVSNVQQNHKTRAVNKIIYHVMRRIKYSMAEIEFLI